MHTVVQRDSLPCAVAVELYLRHHPDSRQRCIRCHKVHCGVRQRAALVLAAARVDPALYDPPPRRPEATHWSTQPTQARPVYRGSTGRG
jgi:hypothetical protein